MELKDIKAIIDLMRKNDLSVFEMEKDGFKLKLVKGPNGQPIITAPIALAPLGGAPGAGAGHGAAGAETAGAAEQPAEGGLKDIVSPMVGTFFRSPSPDAPPFVEVGKPVNPDTVVGIIEAMKVMNEIKAETNGEIAHVF